MIRTRSRKPRLEGDPPVTHEEASLLAAVPGRTGGQEVRIGAFVIAGVIAVVVALFLLTDPSFFRGRYEISTRVVDAGGVRRGDPVQMRGVNIGRIRGFAIEQDGVEVTMELEGEYTVPADSRVLLRSSGLLGGMVAEVIPGRSPTRVRDGASLPGMSEQGLAGLAETATGLAQSASGLTVEADTVLRRVQALLAPQTIGAVGASAGELQQLLAQLSALAVEQRRELAVLSASLQRSAAGVEGAATGPELERSVARVDSLTARLNETTGRLDRASGSLETVLGRVERGEGTLGRLTQEDSLYVNINEAARRVNELVADIQENPRRYINLRVF